MFNSDLLDVPAVVIDNGSGICKAGRSGDIAPRIVLSSVIGYPRHDIYSKKKYKSKYSVGDEALGKYRSLYLHFPIERGQVTAWDDMEKFWSHVLEIELETKPNEQPVLLSEPSLNPRETREGITELMFEKFNVPGFYLANHAAIALYAYACVTGLVVDSGEGLTCVVPIFEGYALPHAVSKLCVAGRDITDRLTRLLLANNYILPCIFNKAVVDDIKEKTCCITLGSDKKLHKRVEEYMPPRQYVLPDGNVISVVDSMMKVPEVLFSPNKMGINNPGLSEMVSNSIAKCDTDIHKDLFAEIVLCGGSTLFRGLEQRLLKELEPLASEENRIRIIASPDRCFSAWIGASVMTSLSTFKQMWVTSSEFNEFGASIVQRKCF
ncbi:actin-related protein T1-like [Ochotona curzoniae]|uniref:actin-related protein T1-like n=1 Tax=Ochotona curzoniae TaxID=130825 RepID=UPI001B34A237|nr:actin-related protein T1-like [Ochotona curzoniae]